MGALALVTKLAQRAGADAIKIFDHNKPIGIDKLQDFFAVEKIDRIRQRFR